MAEKLITAPAIEPVTLTEAKAQCIVETSAYDTLISSKIAAARQLVERYLNRALVTQTWKLQLDEFPEVIRLPHSPLQSVTSITYVDINGDSQTLSASEYQVDAISEPARIVPAYGYSWPSVQDQIAPIAVLYVAGYASDGGSPEDLTANIPQPIKDAILLVVTELYQNREIYGVGIGYSFNSTVESLLFPYRVRPILH